ncbi:MAG: carotenoid oxygenase family protein, partial [Myxococcota bacterium]|nr:carotenoid oxygenase family protein [Myxococcota bacterium]
MDKTPFYLQGNFGPVDDEVEAFDLKVEGEIPEYLEGMFLRNGPNPTRGDPGHWFFGDGMIHATRLEGGRASWYRNRYVDTASRRGAPAMQLTEDLKFDHTVGVSNTHVVSHAGKILALVESSYPAELDRELNTVGPLDFDGKLTTSFTAHPKVCAKTGEMLAFGYSALPPFLTYHRISP